MSRQLVRERDEACRHDVDHTTRNGVSQSSSKVRRCRRHALRGALEERTHCATAVSDSSGPNAFSAASRDFIDTLISRRSFSISCKRACADSFARRSERRASANLFAMRTCSFPIDGGQSETPTTSPRKQFVFVVFAELWKKTHERPRPKGLSCANSYIKAMAVS